MLKVFDKGRNLWSCKLQSVIPGIARKVHYKGVKCSCRFKWFSNLIIILNIYLTISICTYNTTKEVIKRINFDSDRIPFVVENSANYHICVDKSYFEELHLFIPLEKEILGSIGMIGNSIIPEGFGDI